MNGISDTLLLLRQDVRSLFEIVRLDNQPFFGLSSSSNTYWYVESRNIRFQHLALKFGNSSVEAGTMSTQSSKTTWIGAVM